MPTPNPGAPGATAATSSSFAPPSKAEQQAIDLPPLPDDAVPLRPVQREVLIPREIKNKARTLAEQEARHTLVKAGLDPDTATTAVRALTGSTDALAALTAYVGHVDTRIKQSRELLARYRFPFDVIASPGYEAAVHEHLQYVFSRFATTGRFDAPEPLQLTDTPPTPIEVPAGLGHMASAVAAAQAGLDFDNDKEPA